MIMLLKKDLTTKYPQIQEGLMVRCQDGEKLGKISAMNEDSFTVQKGFFFPKDFMFRYDDIADYKDDELIVGTCGPDLQEWKSDRYSGWSQVEDVNAGKVRAEPREGAAMKLYEEKLEAEKVYKEAGRARIRKIVHTELKNFTVPVMHEELRVERTPGGQEAATPEAGAFEEKTVDIPVMKEEVTVSKKPVVKETVHVSKEKIAEERKVSGEVHSEEAKIEGEEQKRKAG